MNQKLKNKLKLADELDTIAALHTEKGWCQSSLFEEASNGQKRACAVGNMLIGYKVKHLEAVENDDLYGVKEIQGAAKAVAKDLRRSGRFIKNNSNSDGHPVDVIIYFNDDLAVNSYDVAAQFSFTANRLRREVYKKEAVRIAKKNSVEEG